VGRTQTVDDLREFTEEISVRDYLDHQRPMPHLFEIAQHMDPSAFAPDGRSTFGSSLSSMVRARGERETDVRLLVDNGERYLTLANDLANTLRCDVYLTPHGTRIRYVHQSSAITGDQWEAVAIATDTEQPVEWLVVRPLGLPDGVATWFTSARGRLRQSNGLVTVALPGGIAFATKATYRDTAHLASRIIPSTNPVTTVAVNAELGRFEITRFDDAGSLLGGVEFATLVSASLDELHPDVQLALTWPTDPALCAGLDTELMRLADGLNRTVWVPQPQGAAFVLPGFGEFIAVDEVGAPSRWRAYPPRLAEHWVSNYGTDLDGRLAPLGEVSARKFAGVPFVSVPKAQADHLKPWYEAIAPCVGLFPLDLAVLPDGRLGVQLADGQTAVTGPRELQVLLRAAGWGGEDLLLLAQPPAEVWNIAIDHARSLVDGLSTDLWLPTLGAEVWVQSDGTLAADGPDGADHAWCCVAFGRSAAEVTLPAALAVPRLSDPGLLIARPGPLAGPTILAPMVPVHGETDTDPYLVQSTSDSADQTVRLAEPTGGTLAPEPISLGRSQGIGSPHGVPWLPEEAVVNERPLELYLWTPHATDEMESWGLPSADLFLLAGQDPLRLAGRRPTGYLLRVKTPERGAIDLLEHARHAPAAVQQRLLDTGATHLLPLAWLKDLRVTARFDLDGQGGVRSRSDVGAGELAIRFEGAEHGVPGLPNEVVHWPDKGKRADAPSYLLLPEKGSGTEVIHQGYVPLSREKPAMEEGHWLLEVKVRRRRAIDIPATLDNLSGLPVEGRMHDFVGLDLLLPEADLSKAVVSKIWRQGPGSRPIVDKLSGETLGDLLTPGPPSIPAPAGPSSPPTLTIVAA
jgi:hypothetical protein